MTLGAGSTSLLQRVRQLVCRIMPKLENYEKAQYKVVRAVVQPIAKPEYTSHLLFRGKYHCTADLVFLKKWAKPGLFLFIFVLFLLQFQYKLKKA